MSFTVQNKRSNTENRQPDPAELADGQVAVNFNNSTPGLFFRTSTGALVKAGPATVSDSAPSPTNYTVLSVGELWFDSVNNSLMLWDGTQWMNISTGAYTSKFIPPTNPTGLPTGALWNNNGTLTLVP